jgi:hypothetical protein
MTSLLPREGISSPQARKAARRDRQKQLDDIRGSRWDTAQYFASAQTVADDMRPGNEDRCADCQQRGRRDA